MKCYAVALSAGDLAELVAVDFPAVLMSFANDKNATRLVGWPDRPVMLDSGAFTAWTTGAQVDVDEYIAYAHLHLGKFADIAVINLDVIPGSASSPRVSDRERDKAIAESARNAEHMRANGIPVVEVYHLFEPIAVLEAILERRREGERISLGGLARWRGGPGATVKRAFCDSTFAYLRDRYGWDNMPPIHGLGISPDGQLGGGRYPWYSVDCSSWLNLGQYGVGVSRNGKRLGGKSDSRVGNQDLRRVYSRRVLDGWARLSDTYTASWAQRGIAYAA